MNQDAYAQATQHQNDLNAWLEYERRLRAAYAKSQNPYPPRWVCSSDGGGLQGDSEFDALG